ncbi:sialidase-like [Macrobrachium rosenbergii]|uniref:sialidase-like n=1 Tax=Macrobrachium rosenbergii TaxID=79674 RepID=UPI0034D4A43B
MRILVILTALGACSAFHHYNYDSNNNYYSPSPSYGSRYRGNNYYRSSLRGLNGRFLGATTPAPAYSYVSTPASAYNYATTLAPTYVSTPASAYNYVSTPASAYNYVSTPASAYNYATTLAPTYNYGTAATSAFRPSTYLGSTPSPLGHYSVSSSTPGYYQPPSYSTSGSYVTPSPVGLYGGSNLLSRNPYHYGTTSSYGNGYSVTPAVLTHHSVQSIYPQNTVTYNPYNVLASSPFNRVNSYSHSAPSNIVVSNGYIQDTPEVAAAKAEFFRLYNSAAAASGNHRYYKARDSSSVRRFSRQSYDGDLGQPVGAKDRINSVADPYEMAPELSNFLDAYKKQLAVLSHATSYEPSPDYGEGASYDVVQASRNPVPSSARTVSHGHPFSVDSFPPLTQAHSPLDGPPNNIHARAIENYAPPAHAFPTAHAPAHSPATHAPAHKTFQGPAQLKAHAFPHAPAQASFNGPAGGGAFPGYSGPAPGPYEQHQQQQAGAPDDAYNFVIPSRIVVHNGYVQDTPEVAAAKEEFYSIFNLQAAAAAAAPDDYDYYESKDYGGVTKVKSKRAMRFY